MRGSPEPPGRLECSLSRKARVWGGLLSLLPFRAGVLGWVACALALLESWGVAPTCPRAWIPAPLSGAHGDTEERWHAELRELQSWGAVMDQVIPFTYPQGQADDRMASLVRAGGSQRRWAGRTQWL